MTRHQHIPIIGLTGPAGCGKDTVASYLSQHAGHTATAFADRLRAEVVAAFGLKSPALLTNRSTKETPTELLSLANCLDGHFVGFMLAELRDADQTFGPIDAELRAPRSPRTIMQWWGTEYRRTQAESYWTESWRLHNWIGVGHVIPDVRFSNEADFVRRHGGQVWKVTRPGVGLINSHASETTGDAFTPERTIYNDRGLPELLTETMRHYWEATSGLSITLQGNVEVLA